MDRIEDVTVIGGGDIGLIAALAVRNLNPGVDVSVVDDFDRDIPRVGKSSYLEITQVLHGPLDIDESRFVTEVRPISKASAYFRDWCGSEFHYTFDESMRFPGPESPDAFEQFYNFYQSGNTPNKPQTICEEIVDQRKSPWYYDPSAGQYDKYDRTAYHLNTERFNSFLREVCRERGIELVDDAIVDVETSGTEIDRLQGESQQYRADLYVDATGFGRVLKAELDSEFVEFPHPVDRAFNVQVDRPLDDIIPATIADTGDHGWFWQIDTYDNRDRGYVYSSEFVSDEEALAEFLDELDADVSPDEVVSHEFTSGYYERAWEGNCVALGNSQGFVEPLQSTNLTANAQGAVQLAKLLSTHGRYNSPEIRETFNDWMGRVWDSINDFISVHYRFSDGDTPFWEAAADIEVSPRVEFLVDEYDRKGFNRAIDATENRTDVADLEVFDPMDFFVIMHNLGVKSSFYEDNDFTVSNSVRSDAANIRQQIADRVDGFVTTKQLYKGALEL